MTFASVFGRPPSTTWWSPGRVNVIGEHTDYNLGFALPFAVPFGVRADAAPRADGVLSIASAQRPGELVEVPIDELVPGGRTSWSVYVEAMAWALQRAGVEVRGADVYVDGDVPEGAGLSSSHALECAAGAVIADIAGKAPDRGGPSGIDLARIGQRAENDYVGAPTGIMDQSASILCEPGSALLLDCRDLTYEQIPLALADAGLAIVAINTHAPHRNNNGEYASRRAECELAAQTLGVSSLREIGVDALDSAEAGVMDRIPAPRNDVVRRRMRHVITENARVLTIADALKRSDYLTVASALNASHISMRDDFEISCPELDCAVDAALAAGAFGARMTGGGFGGTAIALVSADRQAAVAEYATQYAAQRGLARPGVFAVDPVGGLRRA